MFFAIYFEMKVIKIEDRDLKKFCLIALKIWGNGVYDKRGYEIYALVERTGFPAVIFNCIRPFFIYYLEEKLGFDCREARLIKYFCVMPTRRRKYSFEKIFSPQVVLQICKIVLRFTGKRKEAKTLHSLGWNCVSTDRGWLFYLTA